MYKLYSRINCAQAFLFHVYLLYLYSLSLSLSSVSPPADIEMIRLISNVERQQQRNAPPTSATPTSRPDSTQKDQSSFSLKEIQGRIQNAYRLPTPTINVNVSTENMYVGIWEVM